MLTTKTTEFYTRALLLWLMGLLLILGLWDAGWL